jgi:hypothetical protein
VQRRTNYSSNTRLLSSNHGSNTDIHNSLFVRVVKRMRKHFQLIALLILLVIFLICITTMVLVFHYSPMSFLSNETQQTTSDLDTNDSKWMEMEETLKKQFESGMNEMRNQMLLLPNRSPVEKQRAYIDYQVHSWNDLDEWEQGLKKGVTWFKVDLYYTAPSLCPHGAKEQRHKPCFLLSHDAPIPNQSYNTSDELVQLLKRIYVSSGELQHGIGANNNLHGKKQKLYVALCFKYHLLLQMRSEILYRNPCHVPDYDPMHQMRSTMSLLTSRERMKIIVNTRRYMQKNMRELLSLGPDKHWISLVDELFQQLNPLSTAFNSKNNNNKVQMEFILDESGTPGGGAGAGVLLPRTCLRNKWRPWNATFISPRDPSLAFLFNNRELGYDRFQVLNEPVPSSSALDSVKYLARAQMFHYGKFGTKENRYPILVWEPSDQKTIGDVIDTYLNANYIHESGLRFAINMDPIMFRIFMSNWKPLDTVHNEQWNIHLERNGRNDRSYVVVLMNNNEQQETTTCYSIVLQDNMQYKIVMGDIRERNVALPVKQLPYQQLQLNNYGKKMVEIITFSSIMIDKKPIIYLLTSNYDYIQLKYNFETNSLLPIQYGKIIREEENNVRQEELRYGVQLDSKYMIIATSNIILSSSSNSKHTNNNYQIVLQLYQMEQKDNNEIQISAVKSTHAHTSIPIHIKNLVGSSAQSNPVQSLSMTIAKLTQKDNNRELWFGYLICSISKKVYGAHFSLYKDKNLYVFDVPNNLKTIDVLNDLPLSIGESLSISSNVIMDNKSRREEIWLSMVWDGGFCWNSDVHNLQAKRLCELNPLKIDDALCGSMKENNVLSYTFAKFSDIVHRQSELQKQQQQRHSVLLSPCDPNIIHGTYDRGTKPHVTSVYVREDNAIRFFAVHRGPPYVRDHTLSDIDLGDGELAVVTSCICGTAVPHNGPVLDSWTLSIPN